jgi:hypothetical protein
MRVQRERKDHTQADAGQRADGSQCDAAHEDSRANVTALGTCSADQTEGPELPAGTDGKRRPND